MQEGRKERVGSRKGRGERQEGRKERVGKRERRRGVQGGWRVELRVGREGREIGRN